MTKKELKKLAKEIANYERTYQNTSDYELKERAREKITELSEKVYDLNDLVILDSFIQDYLN